jgi:hypothetical protein
MFSSANDMMKYARGLAADAPLFVLNVSNKKSDNGAYSKLSMSIRVDGQFVDVTVPATTAPVDLTSFDAPLTAIRASSSFRDMLAKGFMVVLTEDEAIDLLGREDIQAEIKRTQEMANLRSSIGGHNSQGIEVETGITNTPVGTAPTHRPGENDTNSRPQAAKASPAPAASAIKASDADDMMTPIINRFLQGRSTADATKHLLQDVAKHVSIQDCALALANIQGNSVPAETARRMLLDVMSAKAAPAPAATTAAAPARKPLSGLKLPTRGK